MSKQLVEANELFRSAVDKLPINTPEKFTLNVLHNQVIDFLRNDINRAAPDICEQSVIDIVNTLVREILP